MKFNLFMLPSIPATDEERARLRPIGRNVDKYQEMLEQVRELSVLAEDVGFDAISMTEHHFHSEGYEVSVAPLTLLTDIAGRTNHIKVATLGLVLPTWDPIRVAEEIAVVDNLTKGRLCVGVARGYQDRWANVLGQKNHATGTPMDGGEIDTKNREVFEEVYSIMKAAWTNDSIRMKTGHYEIPSPYEGIARWPHEEYTGKYGVPGEMEDGKVMRVCVVPKPYQQPHPPIWQPFSVSEQTVRWCAAEGIVPWIIISWPETFRGLAEAYRDSANAAGHNFGLGENLAVFRSLHFGETTEQGRKLGTDCLRLFLEYFGGFGFMEAFRLPEDEQKYANQRLPKSEWTYERVQRSGYAMGGSIDDVKRQFEELHANVPVEWFGWYFDQGLMPLDEARRQIEMFGEHIIPMFK
ncbi:MAG TPA: LLM class flavin-dependent oxidoreductase [Pseudonocardia sp.]|jgi:alkanesulfonate monooxygenase SsuD/methylene tetrahydromethanopterin reductase-like flavin-dependent oxidoreductase (luciferase family)